ncbi:(2Fe-2S) ferredoxin domain-containing protein [Nocardioides anomalus]|uniref:(2Fe-2S) ferredoxin domain-containing protein n=2 Tax=Nocardioides anomalus TaxID=2712223 RepID=A0A6G6WL55_9ACTN|nr:(2Fe-2S) ferredoxin domain-containing protein [Nocardioides anomalus]
MSVREVVAEDELTAIALDAGGTVAHLQLGDPTLRDELTRLADAGLEEVTVVGVSLGSLAPAASWLRRVVAHWWRERPEPRPRVAVATRLVQDRADLRAVLAETRPVHGDEAGLRSAAWEDVTRHRHQLLVCRGPRCTALGSDATAEAFVLACMAHDLGDDDVLITHTGCQLPCNHAPVVSVQPDDVWYGGVDADAARAITAEHLVAGRAYAERRLPRTRRDQAP